MVNGNLMDSFWLHTSKIAARASLCRADCSCFSGFLAGCVVTHIACRSLWTFGAFLSNPFSPFWLEILHSFHFLMNGGLAHISLLLASHDGLSGMVQLPHRQLELAMSLWHGLPIAQGPHSKAFGTQCSSVQHTDWVRYGKFAPEFFHGSLASYTSLLDMVICLDKHPELLGAIRLASTLAAAA